MDKLGKNKMILAVLFLCSALFSLTGCDNKTRLYDEVRTTASKLESKPYTKGILPRYYGILSFTLLNSTEETLDIKVKIKIGTNKDGKVSYKTKEIKVMAFLSLESRDFMETIADFTSAPKIYTIDIFGL